MLGSNKRNLLHSRLRHQEKPEFPRFSEPPFDFALYVRWRDTALSLWQFGVRSGPRVAPTEKDGALGGVFLIGRVPRNRGEWRGRSGQWSVASEAEGEKRQNKANSQWPLIACSQGVKLDGFCLVDAKQTQFRVGAGGIFVGRRSRDPAVGPTVGFPVICSPSGTGRPLVATVVRVRSPLPEPKSRRSGFPA